MGPEPNSILAVGSSNLQCFFLFFELLEMGGGDDEAYGETAEFNWKQGEGRDLTRRQGEVKASCV